jgi:hypothetical protein
MLSEDLLPVY